MYEVSLINGSKTVTLKKLHMRSTLFTAAFLLTALSTVAQNSDSTDWLTVKFGAEEAAQIVSAGGQKLALYVFIDAQGHSIDNVAPKDISDLPDALGVQGIKSEVPELTFELLMSSDFHSELYAFNRRNDQPVYYKIGDSGYLLKLEAYKTLQERFIAQQ